MRLRFGILVFFFVCLGSSIALGQAEVGGTVVNGNPYKRVPDITVHLVNKTLNPAVERPAKTNADGEYTFENVVPGAGYSVEVYDATGKLIGSDAAFFVIADKQHFAEPDIDISHPVVAKVAVKSGGSIQLDSGISPGSNITNEQLRVLPLYNRNFLALGLIQPEVHDVEPGSPLQGAAFSIAGSRPTSTNFLLDGVDNVASSSNQAIPFQINEAVGEFRLVYSTPSLRYAQGSGGIVDVRTSSGNTGSKGQRFHGSLFGYFNNDALNANTPLSVYSNSGFAKAAAFANGANALTSNVIYADTGGGGPSSAGTAGPNCLSGGNIFCAYSPQSYNALFSLLGKAAGYGLDTGCVTSLCRAGAFNPSSVLATQDSHNQPVSQKQFGGSIGGPIGKGIFIFGSYEGTLINNPTPIFERVPTFLDKTGLPVIASTGSADSLIAQKVLGAFPAANVGQTGGSLTANSNTGIFGFYRGTAPNYTNVHNVQIRPDISLKSLGTLNLRYTGQLLDQLHDDTLPASSAYPGNGADRRAQNQSAAITYNYPFGTSNRNLLNLAFTQYRVDDVAQDRHFDPTTLGLPAGAMPTIVISGVDPQTTATTSGGQGLIGGWYDSFWQTNCTGNLTTCAPPTSPAAPTAAQAAGSRSPSPITPSLDGDFPLARLGAPQSAPSKRRDTEAFLSDALELQLSHVDILTVGGEYRYTQNFSYDGGQARGLIVSNNIGEFTSDSETCVSCGNAFHHPSFDYSLRQPVGYTGDLRSSSYGAFLENKFQPKPNLTIVAGVRYDYFGQPLDSQNRLWNYNVTNQGLNRQGIIGTFDAFDYQCGGGTTFFDAVYGSLRASTPSGKWACNTGGTFQLPQNKTDFTGLLGASWAPNGKSVIRASAGGYYDRLPATYNQKLLLNRPSPYNVNNPSAIYGQNFASSYSSANCQSQTQCGFGLATLNGTNASLNPDVPSFQNYQAASGANILYERDPKALKTPYTIQFNASYQYRFSTSWTGELGYVGSVGQRLPLIYDGNFTNEFYCTQNSFCNNDTYFPVFTESHIGASNYNSIVLRTEGRLWHGLSMHASYVFSKSLDNIAANNFPSSSDSLFTQLFGRQLYALGNPVVFALSQKGATYGSNGGLRGSELITTGTTPPPLLSGKNSILQSANIPSFDAIQSALTTTGSRSINVSHYSLPQNPLAFSSSGAATGADYGPSDFDVKHRAVADFVYTLRDHGHAYLRGFVLSGITTVQTGQPFSIFSGPAYGQVSQLANNVSKSNVHITSNPSGAISGAGFANLPALSGNVNCPSLYAQPTLYQNSPTAGACLGNSGRNAFTGPAYFSQDLAFQKATVVNHSEDNPQSIIIRAEVFNVFNRANYYNPISELSNDGVHVNPEFGLIRSAHDPLTLQFALRYDF